MEEDILSQARKLFADGEIEKSVELVKSFWLENPDSIEAANLFSELMRESGRSELSKRLNSLSEHLPLEMPSEMSSIMPPRTPSINPFNLEPDTGEEAFRKLLASGKELFETGHGLIDARQHELAAMLLNQVAKIAPNEPTVNYELGFALMSMKHFDQAIPHLEQALTEEADFDTLLNLLVCYTMTRNLSQAKRTLAKMGELKLDPEQKAEYEHRQLVIKRLDSLSSKNKLNSRDWLYVLYGSILLRPANARMEKIEEEPISIALMLALLKGVLEGLEKVPDLVEFYGPQSRPLAQALAEFFEIPFTSYRGPGRTEQALMVMTWASDIIGPHKTFQTKERRRDLFSYALTWDEALPVVPEIVGCLADDEPMPWHEQSSALVQQGEVDPLNEKSYTAEIEKTYKSILYNARDLESDPRTIRNVQDALNYYENKRHNLVLCNSRLFPKRIEYTAEVIE